VPAACTVCLAAVLAGMPYMTSVSSAGSAPLAVERRGEGGAAGVGDLAGRVSEALSSLRFVSTQPSGGHRLSLSLSFITRVADPTVSTR